MSATQLRHTSMACIDGRGALDFDRLNRRGRDPLSAVAEFEAQAYDNPTELQSTASKGCGQRDDGRFRKYASSSKPRSDGVILCEAQCG